MNKSRQHKSNYSERQKCHYLMDWIKNMQLKKKKQRHQQVHIRWLILSCFPYSLACFCITRFFCCLHGLLQCNWLITIVLLWRILRMLTGLVLNLSLLARQSLAIRSISLLLICIWNSVVLYWIFFIFAHLMMIIYPKKYLALKQPTIFL